MISEWETSMTSQVLIKFIPAINYFRTIGVRMLNALKPVSMLIYFEGKHTKTLNE